MLIGTRKELGTTNLRNPTNFSASSQRVDFTKSFGIFARVDGQGLVLHYVASEAMDKRNLEPVRPDPKKNYRTALILVVVMVVGAILILRAYENHVEETQKDDRPSLLTKISETKDLTFLNQQGEVSDLMSLKGKVLVIQSMPQTQPDETTTGVMKRLSEKYKGREDIVFVTLVLDPGNADKLAGELEIVAERLGAEFPQWIVASNERETLHKFIKNEFKASQLPHEEDGKWIYDSSLVLVDKERHVRRAVVPQVQGGDAFVTPFDFEQAKKWDAEGLVTKTELSNEEQMEKLLVDTIEILLNEKIDL